MVSENKRLIQSRQEPPWTLPAYAFHQLQFFLEPTELLRLQLLRVVRTFLASVWARSLVLRVTSTDLSTFEQFRITGAGPECLGIVE